MSLLLFSTSREDIKVWNKAIITSTDIAEKIVDIITTAITSIIFTSWMIVFVIAIVIAFPVWSENIKIIIEMVGTIRYLL